jgi:hypothetical protein
MLKWIALNGLGAMLALAPLPARPGEPARLYRRLERDRDAQPGEREVGDA